MEYYSMRIRMNIYRVLKKCKPFVIHECVSRDHPNFIISILIYRETSKWLFKLPTHVIGGVGHGIWHKIFSYIEDNTTERWYPRFKRTEGERIKETWIKFKEHLWKFMIHGYCSDMLLQYFYQNLYWINKGIINHLVQGGLMSQTFEVATSFLHNMTKINLTCYTQDDQVSPFYFRMTQEKIDKERSETTKIRNS